MGLFYEEDFEENWDIWYKIGWDDYFLRPEPADPGVEWRVEPYRAGWEDAKESDR